MNPQIFSVSGKDILYNAKQIAIASCHERLTITHVALAIFRSRDFQLTEIFQALQINLDSLKESLRQELANIPQKNILQKIIYSTRTEKLVDLAIQKRDTDKPKASTSAVFPTPGSPMSIGLFFLLLRST